MKPDYLCVDAFLHDVAGARALASAFELGLIDALLESRSATRTDLAARASLDSRGLALLLGLLRSNGVVEEAAGAVRLSTRFSEALAYRDLLEAKLAFGQAVGTDFIERFTLLLVEPERFFGEAKLFELFSYDRCFEATPENRAATARWVRITTALTRYEAAPCLERIDLARYRRMLDVGGNSGEFALRACRATPLLRAVVLDLPLVCDFGEAHLRGEPEAGRIAFQRVASGAAELPGGFDLVAFKSMLHDWPDAEMRRFLAQAHRALDPGGSLLIFERAAFDSWETQLSYSLLPLLLFFRSYRNGDDYRAAVLAAGFREVRIELVPLDMPFLLVTATK